MQLTKKLENLKTFESVSKKAVTREKVNIGSKIFKIKSKISMFSKLNAFLISRTRLMLVAS